MPKHKISTCISLAICILSAALLVYWIVRFPAFFRWFYLTYHRLTTSVAAERIIRNVTLAFYGCAPFAAAALGMLIALLRNLLKNRVFINANVRFLRWISWCCYAVTLVTGFWGYYYMPLLIITFATALVGTLLRVVMNVMHAAVALREEQELTI